MESSAHGSESDDQATRELPRVDSGAAAAAAAGGAGGTGVPVGAAGASGAAVPPVHDPLPERDPFAERPEYYVGAAFVGGLLAAQILKRFGR